MLSLDNVYTADGLREFDAKAHKLGYVPESEEIAYSAELKIDGASLSVTYDKGIRTIAATRGDGFVGEVVTQSAAHVRGIPDRIPFASRVEVRGEVVLPRADFEALNLERESEGEDAFANPRNTVAGLLRAKKISSADLARLQFFGYQLVPESPLALSVDVQDQVSVLALLKSWNVDVAPVSKAVVGIDRVLDYFAMVSDAREEVAFDIDGIVVKVVRPDIRERLGATNRTPRWATAFKFPTQAVVTVLEKIDYDVGRTGRVTPRAVLAPVRIGGTTVSSATLNSLGEINRLKLRIGDSVLIEKGGEIIPKVVRVAGKVNRRRTLFKMPTKCPKCGSLLMKEEDGAHYYCLNVSCPARVRAMLVHFASRKAMNIEGLGDGIIDRLVTSGRLADVAGIYELTHAGLAALWKDGEVSATKLLDQINASKGADLNRLVFALGIRHVGHTAAKRLASRLGSLEQIARASDADLRKLPDIGHSVAKSVSSFFADPSNASVVARLRRAGVDPTAAVKVQEDSGPLAGKTIVITGGLSKTRQHFEELIEEAGGKTSSSVTKKTSAVVAGVAAGSKLEKAQRLSVPVWTEEDLMAELGKAT